MDMKAFVNTSGQVGDFLVLPLGWKGWGGIPEIPLKLKKYL